MYNLDEDPGELQDLLVAQPAIAGRLEADLQAYVDSLETIVASTSDRGVMDPETRKRLEALGYAVGHGEPEDEVGPGSDGALDPNNDEP